MLACKQAKSRQGRERERPGIVRQEKVSVTLVSLMVVADMLLISAMTLTNPREGRNRFDSRFLPFSMSMPGEPHTSAAARNAPRIRDRNFPGKKRRAPEDSRKKPFESKGKKPGKAVDRPECTPVDPTGKEREGFPWRHLRSETERRQDPPGKEREAARDGIKRSNTGERL